MYKSLIIVITTIALLMYATQTEAQIIQLANPSFEGPPAASTTPEGWRDCGRPGETPPDTQPNGTFRVFKKAQKGNTYLGLVTRDTDTWEAVGQLLETPLLGGDCYDFSLHLARSESYLSRRRMDTIQTQFTQPIRLRIWGGNNYCDKRELLGETGTIEHTAWKKYDFKLKPRREYDFIMLEAFYMTPTLVAYNGNILMDNCSPITLGSCKDDEPAIVFNEPKEDRKKENVPPTKPREKQKKTSSKDTSTKKKTSKKEEPKPEENPIAQKQQTKKIELPKPVERTKEDPETKTEDKKDTDPNSATAKTTDEKTEEKDKEKKVITIDELDEVELVEGQIIRVNRLNFPANSSVILESNYDVLEEVFNFLTKNLYIVIEIGGHTNSVISHEYSNKLSKERAESVAQYLIDKGISKERITAKGYGKTKPIDTNETLSGRRKNQRVEIKIISTGK